MELTRPRVGFVGVGWIGRRCMKAITSLDRVDVVAIADPDESERSAAACIAPEAERLASFDELLARELDAVVIATPNAHHATQAVAALERGLHVFCQKPLGRGRAEVERVVSAARRHDLLVHVDLPHRHNAAFVAVHRLVTSGALGKVFAGRFVFHVAHGPDKPWFYDVKQAGGGCLLDLGTHLVDAALWMFPGDPVVSVDGQAFSRGLALDASSAPCAEDYVGARLGLRSGARIEIECSWRLPAGKEAIIGAELYGPSGGASVRNVEGSTDDFVAYRHVGDSSELLCGPPDAWSGRAITHFAEQLVAKPRFDPRSEQLIELAALTDSLYAVARGRKRSA